MSTGVLTHKLMRVATRTKTVEIMHRGGVVEPVELVTHERTCLCGQVFVADSELVSVGRYLAHLPKPKAQTQEGGHE